MLVNTIQNFQTNNNPNFEAFVFKNKKVRKQFLSELEKQNINDLNESLNIINSQETNLFEILVFKSKNTKNPDSLNFKAIINKTKIIEAKKSLLQFIKKCGEQANNYKFEQLYQGKTSFK